MIMSENLLLNQISKEVKRCKKGANMLKSCVHISWCGNCTVINLTLWNNRFHIQLIRINIITSNEGQVVMKTEQQLLDHILLEKETIVLESTNKTALICIFVHFTDKISAEEKASTHRGRGQTAARHSESFGREMHKHNEHVVKRVDIITMSRDVSEQQKGRKTHVSCFRWAVWQWELSLAEPRLDVGLVLNRFPNSNGFSLNKVIDSLNPEWFSNIKFARISGQSS